MEEAASRSGRAFAAPSHALINGAYAIRAAHVNHRSTWEDMDALVEGTLAIGKEVFL